MRIGDYTLMTDTVTKFYNTVRVSGWFHHPDDPLASIAIAGTQIVGCVSEIGVPHGGVLNLGPNLGFVIQFLRPQEPLDEQTALVATTQSGWSATVPLLELAADRASHFAGKAMFNRFYAEVEKMPQRPRMLDIGGRDRSGNDYSRWFPGADVTVLDILPGQNVDVVADAHSMADCFPADYFDAIFCTSVFEHLMMPWAVVPQMNTVMKPGAIAYIITHQTVGMHDLPWDFWRFSDQSWDALFNRHTGFEILGRVLEDEQYILPFLYQSDRADAERAVGYERSAVFIRKIGRCTMAWPLAPADLTSTMYPSSDR